MIQFAANQNCRTASIGRSQFNMPTGLHGNTQTTGLGIRAAIRNLNNPVTTQNSKCLMQGCIVARDANQRLLR